jgi:hypothetical protein
VQGLGAIDLSSFTWQDYVLIGVTVLTLYSVVDSKGGFSAVTRKRKPKRGGGLDLGGLVIGAGVFIAAYVGYLYFTQQPSGESLL